MALVATLRRVGRIATPVAMAVTVATVSLGSPPPEVLAAESPRAAVDPAKGLRNLRHLIFIVQENRSFDHYFGTFPGANGLPRRPDGSFAVCVLDPEADRCRKPFHDTGVFDAGGPHNELASDLSINGGAMDGFIQVQQTMFSTCRKHPTNPECEEAAQDATGRPDVMGFHTARELPNYWAWASRYVLHDRMFAATDSYTMPAHLYLVSGWSARCDDLTDVTSCVTDLQGPDQRWEPADGGRVPYLWADITWLLYQHDVTWAYYVGPNTCVRPPCPSDETGATSFNKNPLAGFKTVARTGQLGRIRPYADYFDRVGTGRLPAVSWVVPTKTISEHPPQGVDDGQAFVTRLVNAAMRGPDWHHTAVFLIWDDWGGFYDHVPPPIVDEGGYGIRVPSMLISPWADRGLDIDHQTLSYDAYLKLIEDRFLGGQRLDPQTDGWWDPRPTIREEVAILGDLSEEFDFSQDPIPPLILDPRP